MKRELALRFYKVIAICMIISGIVIAGKTFVHADDVPGVTNSSIKIGCTLDQTGPAANVTIPITQAVRTHFRQINEQGGIHGRKINLLVEDDRYSIPTAISAFKKLVFKDEVFILMGPGSSGAVNALIGSIQKHKIPSITLVMPEITVKPFKRYMFIYSDTYVNQMKVLIDYMLKDRKPKEPRIGIAYPDNETGKVDRDAALPILKSYNIVPVCKEVLNPGAFDASSQVMNFKRADVNHILLCGFIPQTTGVLLKDLKKYGCNVPVFANYASASEEVIQMVGDAAKEWYVIHSMASWYDGGSGVARMREATLKYYPGTEKPYRGKHYTVGWVWTLVTAEGLKRAGRNIDREGWINAMEDIKDFDTEGLCGPISYSSNSHKGGSTWKVFKASPDTGKFIPLTGWKSTD